MFALSQLARRPLRISVKCEPELAEQLREAHPAVLPGYHLNKKHWNTMLIDGSLPEQMINMIEDSYDLIVSQLPESRRRSLESPAASILPLSLRGMDDGAVRVRWVDWPAREVHTPPEGEIRWWR